MLRSKDRVSAPARVGGRRLASHCLFLSASLFGFISAPGCAFCFGGGLLVGRMLLVTAFGCAGAALLIGREIFVCFFRLRHFLLLLVFLLVVESFLIALKLFDLAV